MFRWELWLTLLGYIGWLGFIQSVLTVWNKKVQLVGRDAIRRLMKQSCLIQVLFSSYQSQPENLVAGQNLSLAKKSSLSKYMLWEPSGYGFKLIRLTGMVGCLVSLLRFSVSQNKHTQQADKALAKPSAPAVTTNTKYKCWIQWSLARLTMIVSRAAVQSWAFVHDLKCSQLKHLGSSLIKDVLKTSIC